MENIFILSFVSAKLEIPNWNIKRREKLGLIIMFEEYIANGTLEQKERVSCQEMTKEICCDMKTIVLYYKYNLQILPSMLY